MLTKRTNILFDPELWNLLVAQSQTEKLSIGELVRKAVVKTYVSDEIQERRSKAIQRILAIRKKQKGKVNYKELINYGRKY